MFRLPLIGSWLLRAAAPHLVAMLRENPAVRRRVIGFVNAQVNLPRLDEQQEEKLLNAIWDAMEAALAPAPTGRRGF